MESYKKAYQEFHCSSLEIWIYGRNLYIGGTLVLGENNAQQKIPLAFLLTTNTLLRNSLFFWLCSSQIFLM